MRRGTTPTLTLTVDADLTGHTVYVTLRNDGGTVELTNDRLTLDVADNVTTLGLTLTQQETLALCACPAEVQVRAIKDGVAIATDIRHVSVSRILKEGAINE